ncbi:MAG: hypothetical protein N3B21_05425 [Clostridia bacterium]|nr:hypothetical protein [Clostridia bacterium]
MSMNNAVHKIKIEAGQILEPNSFPLPNELVCIEALKVLDQAALRECVTECMVLSPESGACPPNFSFRGAEHFRVTEVKIISMIASPIKPGFKRLKLVVKLEYNILYSDGINNLSRPEEAIFNLTVNEIYCPSSLTQAGVIRYPKVYSGDGGGIMDKDGFFLEVESRADVFDDVICPCTGSLMLDIGAFFIVRCGCVATLLVPSYGYCPVPLEQRYPAAQNCLIFNKRNITPFPTQFFIDQKWNPLDA